MHFNGIEKCFKNRVCLYFDTLCDNLSDNRGNMCDPDAQKFLQKSDNTG